MLLTPLLFIVYDKVIAPNFSKSQTREQDEMDEESQIIIAGRGRMGGIVDRILRMSGYESTVIDFNSDHLEIIKKFGINHTFFGDATRPDLLHAAGIEDAKMLVITIDDKAQINKLVAHVKKHYPKVHIVARAINRDHVYQLWSLGCRDIIRETYDSSLRIGRSALIGLGIDEAKAHKMVHEFDQWDRKSMRELADVYDISIPAHKNEVLLKEIRDTREKRETELKDRIEAVLNSDADAQT
jgi:CPA2 family monovalent cation:H+ antiporter-2